MKITLSKISHNERLSEETHCFDATVKIDGKIAFGVCNHGHGGNNEYYDLNGTSQQAAYAEVKKCEEYLEGLPFTTTKIHNKDGTFFKMSVSLDSVICDLINDYLDKKNLFKMLKRSWVFASKDGVFTLPKSAHLDQVEREGKTSVILNNLTPESALEMYKQYCAKS